MTSRMDALLAALDRQGFKSRQSLQGSWFFTRNGDTTVVREPQTPREWIDLLYVLRSAGLIYPDED